jgi:ribosomal peptide maturation radical SAM protein 1
MTKRRKGSRSRNWTVGLVSMPFKDLRHPPIQLGILESCLAREGISARSHSLELAFMEHLQARTARAAAGPLTIADYQQIAHQAFVVQLGDWIFKVPPYAASAADDEAYLACIHGETSDQCIANAKRMRELVPSFLDVAANELLEGAPRVIGFSSVFQQNVPSLVLAKILKERDPSLTIVFGGDNCEGPMGAALHECFPWVDVVVRGEGERALVEIVKDVLAGRPIRPQPGLCYRDAAGRSVVVPESSKPELSMDEVPTPVYDEYFDRLVKSPLQEELWPDVAILFESSRGCWWGAKSHCTFCGLNAATMMFRSKPAERVAREIFDFAERHKVLSFVAVDDIIELAHIRDLMPMLRQAGCDLSIFYETKANLTKDQVRAFYSAGVTAIQPGIESLSTPILKSMRKGITGWQNIRLLKWCAEIGVVPSWNVLYGFPGEAPEDYDRMADLVPSLVHLEPPKFTPVQVQRFSPYFEHAADFGIEIVGPMPYYRFLYPVEEKSLRNLVYDFEHRYFDGRDPATYTRKLGEAIARWREVAGNGYRSLSFRRGPGFLVVNDRRPDFEKADYQFDGVEAEIYLACDAGATPERIHAQLSAGEADKPDVDEIREFLDELVDSKVMYREGNVYLALAVAANGNAVQESAAQTQAVRDAGASTLNAA